MKIISSIQEWQTYRRQLTTQSIGFVPTMGNLHQGHASLLKRARDENEVTVLSIYVNPTQFNQASDLEKYPRTMEADLALAASLGVDAVFCPRYEEIYLDEYRYQISEHREGLVLEGEKRPGHFTGVLTIVMKLFQLVRPLRAYFGEKDYQQYQLIHDMSSAFFLEIEVVLCPTVREASGLAMSSRNNRLTLSEKTKAADFAKILQSTRPLGEVKQALIEQGFEIDYVTEYAGRRYGAVIVGEVRLIDNVEIPV